MDKLKKIVGKHAVAMLSCLMFLGSIFGTESKVDQYNGILQDGNITRVRASSDKLDNIAAIRVQGQTYILSSSIINGYLVKDDLANEKLKKKAQDLYPAGFQPISVLDLLYMYNRGYDNQYLKLVVGNTLQDKVNAARQNSNRLLMEKLIKIVLQAYNLFPLPSAEEPKNPSQASPLDKNLEDRKAFIDETIVNLVENEDPALGLEWTGIIGWTDGTDRIWDKQRQQRLNLLKNAIVDFLFRLRKYAKDVAVIPDGIEDVMEISKKMENILAKSNHYFGTRIHLFYEINLQIQEMNAKTDINVIVRGIDNLVRLIQGPWMKILGDINEHGEEKYPPYNSPNRYVSAITHTEQMIDWISDKFGENILVKISGKMPCLKCSHYIQYAKKANGDGDFVKDAWNTKTIIGFNIGWTSFSEIGLYRYPTKVFFLKKQTNKNEEQIYCQFLQCIDNKWQFIEGGNSDEQLWNQSTKDGLQNSDCYAITNEDLQFNMAENGNVIISIKEKPEEKTEENRINLKSKKNKEDSEKITDFEEDIPVNFDDLFTE